MNYNEFMENNHSHNSWHKVIEYNNKIEIYNNGDYREPLVVMSIIKLNTEKVIYVSIRMMGTGLTFEECEQLFITIKSIKEYLLYITGELK